MRAEVIDLEEYRVLKALADPKALIMRIDTLPDDQEHEPNDNDELEDDIPF